MKRFMITGVILFTAFTALVTQAGGHGGSDHGKSHDSTHKSQNSIVDIALSNEDFSTLVTALKKADLVGALQGDGPFTVVGQWQYVQSSDRNSMLSLLSF